MSSLEEISNVSKLVKAIKLQREMVIEKRKRQRELNVVSGYALFISKELDAVNVLLCEIEKNIETLIKELEDTQVAVNDSKDNDVISMWLLY